MKQVEKVLDEDGGCLVPARCVLVAEVEPGDRIPAWCYYEGATIQGMFGDVPGAPMTFHAGFGFLTEAELFDLRQSEPRLAP